MIAWKDAEPDSTLDAARPCPELQGMGSAALFALLDAEGRDGTMAFMDWLLGATPGAVGAAVVIEEICNRFWRLGVPIDRYRTSSTVATADADALGRTWERGKGLSETVYVRSQVDDPDYLNSPFREASASGGWVDLWLPDTADDRFGIVPELKAAGYMHYICMELSAPVGITTWLTLATKSPNGFSRRNRIMLALIAPVLGALISIRITRLMLDRLLRTYVGDEPHRAILDGNVKRGQVSTIRSAILFADMRDSTGHTSEISAVDAVDLFNQFFDCLVPPIESRRGEVLKYIGDGLLAIFRDDGDGARDATHRALEAAREGLDNVALFNATRPDHRPVELGIALHFGEAAYGNVGSGMRLDFTVIGRDVGLASRIGGLNARLAEPLLMSAAFVRKLGLEADSIGAFTVRGFSTPVAVFRPS